MRRLIGLAGFALLAAGLSPQLDGAWTVDLTPSPTAPRYTKPMVLKTNADGTVTGEFYNSTIEAGRHQTSKGRSCFAFRTTDGVGPYHTSGCLNGDRIDGQTWAEQRNFLFVWSATRDGK